MRQRPVPNAPRQAGLPAYCPALPPRKHAAVPPLPIARPRRRRNARGEKLVTVAQLFDATASDAQLPMIRLRGRWLQRLGFRVGERIAVSEEHGRIVLTLAGEEER